MIVISETKVIQCLKERNGFIELSQNAAKPVVTAFEKAVEKGLIRKAEPTLVSNAIYFLPEALDLVAEYMYNAMQTVAKLLVAKEA